MSTAIKEERLLQVILAPVVSEKATMLADKREQVIFRVASSATKPEVKAAVELLFKVRVASVQMANVKGKNKSFRMRAGKRSDWKKAYVRVQEGQSIDFLGGESA